MATPLLPQLKNGETITDLNAGQWYTDSDDKLLQSIYEKMEVPEIIKDEVPHSIPSIFEHPVQIYNALNNPAAWTSVAATYIQQWRAMIALIALDKVLGLKLHVKKITLEEEARNEFLSLCTYDVIFNFRDEDSKIIANSDWRENYVIALNYDERETDPNRDIIIGMTSPYTLLAPSKNFLSILNKYPEVDKLFHFLDYELLKNAVIKDKNEFSDNCMRVLAQQFEGMKIEYTNGILEWVKKLQQNCNQKMNDFEKTLLYNLINDFITSLRTITDNNKDKQEWRFPEVRYVQDLFGIEEKSPYKVFDYTLKVIDDEEKIQRCWNALFLSLALSRVANIPIKIEDNIISISGVKVASANSYSVFEPHQEIFNVIGKNFKFIEKRGKKYELNLSKFETECALQWIQCLKDNVEDNMKDNEILKYYIEQFKQALPKEKETDGEKLKWGENCFYQKAFTDSVLRSKHEEMFNFTIHGYKAAFFYDTDGEHQKKAVNDWATVLKIIAISDLRKIDIKFLQEQSIDKYADDNQDELFNFEDSSRYICHGIYSDGILLAKSSRSTLIHPMLDDKVRKALNNLIAELTPGRTGLVIDGQDEGRRYIRGYERSDNKEKFEIESALYDYEILLLSHWFKQLIDRMKKREYINKESTIYNQLCEKLNNERNQLLKKIQTHYEEDNLLFSYYDYEKNNKQVENTLSVSTLFANAIQDKIFNDNVIIISKYNDNMVSEIYNTDGKNISIETVYDISEDGKSHKSEINNNMLLPFSEYMMENLYNGMDYILDSEQETTIGYYKIEYLKIYDLKESKDYQFCFKHSKIKFPIIKVFNKADCLHLGSLNYLPQIVTWPDVEIKGWNAYYLTYVDSNIKPREAEDVIQLQTPRFIESDITETVNMPIHDKTFTFKVNKLKQFPRILKMSVKARGQIFSGYHMVAPRSRYTGDTQKPRYIEPVKDTKAIIGIDFGTTNTTAFIKRDTETEQFCVFAASSQLLARNFSSELEKLQIIGANQATTNIAAEFNTTLIKYSQHLQNGEPFKEANIFHMLGTEDTRIESIIHDSLLFKRNLKWKTNDDENDVSDIKAFFFQLAMQCCVMAVKMEKVGEVEFRISYPTSMPRKKRMQIKTQWDGILNELNEVTGLEINCNDGKYFYTESHASGISCMERRSADNKQADFNQGFSCVDIGGGSTDISFWQSNKEGDAHWRLGIKDYLSVAYAGRTILTGGLDLSIGEKAADIFNIIHQKLSNSAAEKNIAERNKDIQNPILTQTQMQRAIVVNSIQRLRLDKASYQSRVFDVDCIIAGLVKRFELSNPNKNFCSDILRPLVQNGRTQRDLKVYLSNIKISLAGLFYFMGMVAAKLSQKEKEAFEFRNNQFIIYLAGNGSKSLDWIMYNNDEIEFDFGSPQALMEAYVKAGIDDYLTSNNSDDDNKVEDIKVRIFKSQYHKQETAYGLVHADQKLAADNLDIIDSISPVNIDRLIVEQGDRREFVEEVEKVLAAAGFNAEEIEAETETGEVNTIVENLTSIINPDYKKDKIINLLGDFLKVFWKYSKEDFNLLFPNKSVNVKEGINESNNEDLLSITQEYYSYFIAPPKNNEPIFPIRDFNGYALLKFLKVRTEGEGGK